VTFYEVPGSIYGPSWSVVVEGVTFRRERAAVPDKVVRLYLRVRPAL
jgi:hypothetical protein